MTRRATGGVCHPPARIPHASPARGEFRNPQSALTLIELLIVLAILSILVGSAIPVLAPANEERRIREAARGLNTYLTGAQTRAIETGRPFGVRLRKLSRDTGRDADNAFSIEVSYVEVPPPFAGFDESSLVRIAPIFEGTPVRPRRVFLQFLVRVDGKPEVELPAGFEYEVVPPIFRVGDVIRIAGQDYRFDGIAGPGVPPANQNNRDNEGFFEGSAFRFTATPISVDFPQLKPNYNDVNGLRVSDGAAATAVTWTEPLPYQIFRQPTPTSNEPYQLPDGVAIDLRSSGVGDPINGGLLFFNDDDIDNDTNTLVGVSNRQPVDILFTPEGTIERLQYDSGSTTTPAGVTLATTDTLYLLIGPGLAIPRAPAEADFGSLPAGLPDADLQDLKAEFNWLNDDSRWVTIGARTGTVRTAPNTFVDPVAAAGGTTFPAQLTLRRDREISLARGLANEGVTVGGK